MGCNECSGKVYPKLTGAAMNARVQALVNFSGLMVIGESPTAMEASRGTIMSGQGAQVLKDTLLKVGMPYKDDEVYYTTALKCAVPKKKGQKIPSDAPVNCRQYLLNEIRVVQPSMILVCGSTAITALYGDSKLKVSEMYGRVFETDFAPGAKIIPIMNPGLLIHKPGDYKPFLTMLQLASTIFHGGDQVDTGETKWTVLDSEAKCDQLWQEMMYAAEDGSLLRAAYDIETTGLDYRVVDFLVMGICFEKNHTWIIPREMRHLVHNFLEGIKWKCIWQNGKYDKKVMWRRNLGTVHIDEDTQYMHYVLDETSEHGLGYLSKTFLNAKEYKYKMNQQFKVITLENYPQYFESLCERVAVDCDYTFQLADKFDELHHDPENACLDKLYHELLIPAANYLTRIEQNGVLVNAKYLDILDKKYKVILENILAEVDELASPFWDPELYKAQTGAKTAFKNFKAGSSKQMSWMVFDRLRLKPRVKKGRSTNADVLESIENPPPLIKKVLEYRTVKKEHSTYVIGILNARDVDGRVRTNFTLHVTATGRLSSKEPNMQNQPSANGVGNIRKAFIPAPGKVFAEIDYSGAELRWLAFLSGCPVLSKVFIEGRNLHTETATALFGEHFTKIEKMRAKAVNFGIPYGRESKSFVDEFDITEAEAQAMIDGWLDTYHGARDYLKWCADQVQQGNYLETPWGRRRRFGLVTAASLHSLQNEAKNFPIQSSSSDLLLWCGMAMEETLEKQYNTKQLDLIHDSDLMEIPADEQTLIAVARYCNDVMVRAPKELFDCPIPFKTDFEIGVNWGELVTFDYNEADPARRIQIEHKDGTMEYHTFDEWYQAAMAAEDRYDDLTRPFQEIVDGSRTNGLDDEDEEE
jgi:uracil-DNA glycosylase family 4